MRKTVWLFAILAVLVGTALISSDALAASKQQVITQSFQAMLDRAPTTTEMNYWLGKSDSDLGTADVSGYPGIRRVLNGSVTNMVPDRRTAINNIFNRALKRNPRTDELNFHINHATPTNLIREQLFSSAERRLAIIDVYVNILGRQPVQTDLDFYYRTRSDISRIVTVLIASTERGLMINIVFAPLGREATDEEIDSFNTDIPPREGAQWPYYYRHDIYLYVVDVLAQVEFTCDFESGTNNTISGTVTNAITGEAFEQTVTVRLIDYDSEEVITTTTPDADGNYSLTGLAAGSYKVQIDFGDITGFAAFSSNVCISGTDTTTAVPIPISPALSAGEMRVVLSWGENPSDLDSHLVGPLQNSNSRFHVYFADQESDDSLVNLDVDDVTSYGPETVTVNELLTGTYYYYVHHYSGSSDIANSGVNVKVYDTDGLVSDYSFNRSSGCTTGVDDIWEVFSINGATGTVSTINTCDTETGAPT